MKNPENHEPTLMRSHFSSRTPAASDLDSLANQKAGNDHVIQDVCAHGRAENLNPDNTLLDFE